MDPSEQIDWILLHGMVFYGYHGYIPAEQQLGQRFTVNLELGLNVEEAASNDDIEKTVDYREVYQLVRRIVEHTRYKLLEALAHDVIEAIFERFAVEVVRVEIRKPQVPITGAMEYVAVRLERRRCVPE